MVAKAASKTTAECVRNTRVHGLEQAFRRLKLRDPDKDHPDLGAELVRSIDFFIRLAEFRAVNPPTRPKPPTEAALRGTLRRAMAPFVPDHQSGRPARAGRRRRPPRPPTPAAINRANAAFWAVQDTIPVAIGADGQLIDLKRPKRTKANNEAAAMTQLVKHHYELLTGKLPTMNNRGLPESEFSRLLSVVLPACGLRVNTEWQARKLRPRGGFPARKAEKFR